MSHRKTSIYALLALALLTTGLVRAQGDASRGEKVFQECVACHLPEGSPGAIGPNLRGLFGRRAASREDFRYSPALRRSNITWSAQTLDEYLADPQKMVPANRMPYAGLPKAADRADLIEYLQKAYQ
jgi:cytochrome c